MHMQTFCDLLICIYVDVLKHPFVISDVRLKYVMSLCMRMAVYACKYLVSKINMRNFASADLVSW